MKPTKNIITPDDYKDYIYRLTYYILAKFIHRVPRRLTPNQITVAAFISAMLGCLLLYVVRTPAGYLYWAVCNFIWYILDAMDGAHARLTGQTSEFGGFLDHFLDNIFFIFMFTVFVIRFDLLHPLYIFIILLRMTGATSVFLVQAHTGKVYLSRFSGGFELFLMTTAMLLSYFFPHFHLTHLSNSPVLLKVVDFLSLQQGVFMKLILLVYAIGVPMTLFIQYLFAKDLLLDNSKNINHGMPEKI